MKKYFILAAIAITALASCTKDEPVNTAEPQKITFEAPVIGTATKLDLPTVFPNDQDFGVFALHYADKFTTVTVGTKYMDNVTVSPTDYTIESQTYKTWVSDYYWPKAGTLTFAAYAPVDNGVSATHNESGIKFTDFTVPTKANTDLLFSERAYDKVATSQDASTNPLYYGVDIEFKHALSAVIFNYKAAKELVDESGPKYEFIITEVTVNGVYNKGTFDQQLDTYTGTGDYPKTKDATTVKGWEIATDATAQQYTAYKNDTGITVNSETAVSAYSSMDNKADLILLPQVLDRTTDSKGKVTVKVKYKMRHDQMEKGKYIDNNEVEADLSTSSTGEWLRGKRYIYTLTIALDKIYLEPKMTNWESGDNIDITIPDSNN